jgi:hypothetical protein
MPIKADGGASNDVERRERPRRREGDKDKTKHKY